MKITVENRVPVSASIDPGMVEDYLRRTGWNPRVSYRALSYWTKATSDSTSLVVRVPPSNGTGAEDALNVSVYDIAEAEQRQPGDVLSDIVGFAILDRGTAINRLATAGARLVEAQETEKRVPAYMTAEREIARSRRQEAERDVEKAKAALAAAEGVGR